MIVIVGHGPSAGSCPPSIDDHTVIRLMTVGYPKRKHRLPHPGTRTDYWVSTHKTYEPDWLIDMKYCRSRLAPFSPHKHTANKNGKPSTGLCACIMARDKFPNEVIKVTGFDWTLNPETAVGYIHDAYAENACFKTLDIGVFNG